jgi:hypothetical protein
LVAGPDPAYHSNVSAPPEIRFLSLFVPSVQAAALHYQQILGVEPTIPDRAAVSPHPFAGSAPVVFQLGAVALALYECNPDRGTHPGDVGIGVVGEGAPAALAERAQACGARVFYGPKRVPGDGRELAVFVLPDRHFFEVADRPSRA